MATRIETLSRFPRVPPGRHGLPRAFVAEHQRRRLLAATAELVAKRGYQNTALTRICSVAGVARNTFYEHFSDKEQCLLATIDDGIEQAERAIEADVDPDGPWAEQLRDGLAALLDFVASEPALARTCLVEPLAAGPAAIERYEAVVQRLIPFFGRGRAAEARDGEVADTMEETIVRGLGWILNQRLVMNEARDVDALLPELLEFALAPYIGDEAARRASERSLSPPAS